MLEKIACRARNPNDLCYKSFCDHIHYGHITLYAWVGQYTQFWKKVKDIDYFYDMFLVRMNLEI